MSVYRRYKQSPEGFRQLVSLLETTPLARRQKMIDVGMAEDANYTRAAVSLIMTFDDALELSEPELAEVLAHANARIIALSIANLDVVVQARFLACAPLKVVSEIRDHLEAKASAAEIGAARLKLVAMMRECERSGYLGVKRIPVAA